jgi:hypothetical protein
LSAGRAAVDAPAAGRRARDPLALAVLAPAALSAALLVAAMAAYPGGRWADPRAEGFDLVRNYLCDLIRPVAHDGRDNATGMRLAQAALLLQAVALLPLWWLVGRRLLPRAELAAAVRASGVLAALLLPAVAFTPSDGTSRTHALAIGAAGAPGLLALGLGAWGLLARAREWPGLAVLTALLLAASGATGALWLVTFSAAWPDAWMLPLAQKLAWALLQAWGVALARGAPAG